MASKGVNKVILIGNVGSEPEVRYLPNGNAVANVTLATSDSWRDKQSGQMQERTEWHRIVFFGKIAEVVGQYVGKGSKIYVEGRLQTREWEKDGIKRYTTEIVVDMGGSMQMLDGRSDNAGGGKPASAKGAAPAAQGQGQQRTQAAPAQQRQAPVVNADMNQSQQPSATDYDSFGDDIPF